MLVSRIQQDGQTPAQIVAVLCPGCRREGNFRPIPNVPDAGLQFPSFERPNTVDLLAAGQRVCPNAQCSTHVFVVYKGTKLLAAYPVGRIDFDSSGVPESVTKPFEEALTCTAQQCYVAAAMLIRKTLEGVCADRGAVGDSLKARIADLRRKATLPQELFDALDQLRLLGNDAAHIEAQTYNDVGPDEVAAGIELAKEIVKATYQYKGLLAKLAALKKPAAPAG